eukprot:TRINITY_DN1127_c1_g2_i1.p1 TRINITY_DN1127_c1_g2~~TRINITY_DN1127_c1_g2_i1.p1  ORF type:complete len:251 (-),score=80.03 TRINITY_DN1127_c1_g2_i1:78-788(-)
MADPSRRGVQQEESLPYDEAVDAGAPAAAGSRGAGWRQKRLQALNIERRAEALRRISADEKLLTFACRNARLEATDWLNWAQALQASRRQQGGSTAAGAGLPQPPPVQRPQQQPLPLQLPLPPQSQQQPQRQQQSGQLRVKQEMDMDLMPIISTQPMRSSAESARNEAAAATAAAAAAAAQRSTQCSAAGCAAAGAAAAAARAHHLWRCQHPWQWVCPPVAAAEWHGVVLVGSHKV